MELASKGFLIAFSLFAAIGAQNVFVLKNGIMKNHIFYICLTCILCDIILVSIGIFGIASFIAKNKIITILFGVIGGIFVLVYGLLALKSAFKADSSLILKNNGKRDTLQKTIIQTLFITLINPHVYLDTIIILGAISLPLDFYGKIFFACGVICASISWFFCLGFASYKASILFKNPKTWVFLDLFTAIVMFVVAYGLISFTIEQILSL